MKCGRVVPRLPLGYDDDSVVNMARKAPEKAEGTWEPVPRVFDGATTVLREKLKALRLKTDQKRGLVQRHGL